MPGHPPQKSLEIMGRVHWFPQCPNADTVLFSSQGREGLTQLSTNQFPKFQRAAVNLTHGPFFSTKKDLFGKKDCIPLHAAMVSHVHKESKKNGKDF